MIPTLSRKHSFDLIFHSQQVFRLILEAMSNPTRVVNIKKYADRLFGECPALLTVAVTLLDNEASFNTCGSGFTDDIVSLTFAKPEKAEVADFIFVRAWNDIRSAVESAKCGTLSDPHKSAMVVIQNDDVAYASLALCGPGIEGVADVLVTKTVEDAIILRDAQHYEYPQGIDLIFVSGDGELLAIPRSVRIAGNAVRGVARSGADVRQYLRQGGVA